MKTTYDPLKWAELAMDFLKSGNLLDAQISLQACIDSEKRKLFASLLQSAEDDRRETLNESDSNADSYYSLRDDGRNPDGSGESYTERNA